MTARSEAEIDLSRAPGIACCVWEGRSAATDGVSVYFGRARPSACASLAVTEACWPRSLEQRLNAKEDAAVDLLCLAFGCGLTAGLSAC